MAVRSDPVGSPRFAIIVIVFFFSFVAPAAAQQAPALGVTLGYDALRVSNNPCDACRWKWYQFGFNVDAAMPVGSPRLQAVGEFAWARHPFRENPNRHVGGLNAISLGGGLRYSSWRAASFTPYVQMLVGLHRDSFDGGSGPGLLGFTGPGIPANSFMVHPGAGVYIPVRPMWGVVGQVDYRRVFSDEANNAVRVVAGIRLNRQ